MTQKTFVFALTLTGLMILSACGFSYASSNLHTNLEVRIDTTYLLPFKASRTSQGILLTWEGMERLYASVNYYELQHSADGIQFSTIAVLDSTINAHLHKPPIIGDNFYRLGIIEDAGSYDYTGVLLMRWDITESIFPNPVRTKTTIHLISPTEESGQLRVYDMNGRLVHSSSVELYEDNTIIGLDCSGWSSGEYIITISGEQFGEEVIKLLKQ